jgi:hypothetical protein
MRGNIIKKVKCVVQSTRSKFYYDGLTEILIPQLQKQEKELKKELLKLTRDCLGVTT